MALMTFFGIEFGVSDFFDIAGLTLLFYFLFLFISDKRALKLVLGVLVITGIALAASIFVQLGDTLATIAAQQALCEEQAEK